LVLIFSGCRSYLAKYDSVNIFEPCAVLGLSLAIGFDGAGYIYVADTVPGEVNAYAPGASGNAQLVRWITVYQPGSMAVTKAGYPGADNQDAALR
jgi:hypothetical protein